ncbi:deacetylase [Salinisphaera orenii MK-B5]|uniref:Deacetylase n=1 Tax=Salinisphaera orenii MK-B5 TaxID=856730 RepID=A0A423PH48_9GAMM|nr:histone deacetylase family protein [Salinisphaera orenii]ROO24941.1 deacetylase [Salinisphaera orenii MK-B5]
MTTAYFSHEDCARHDMGGGHPESPGRLEAVEKGLGVVGVDQRVQRRVPEPAPFEAIRRVHTDAYVDGIVAAAPDSGMRRLDGDTAMNAYSLSAARHAAGAVIDAADAVMAGEVANAFCAVRPPGHHAERDRAMGFCLFDSIAVGAAHALAVHGLSRVAILDFDVHHGNGTEDVFTDEPRVLFCSSYQNPLFPFTSDTSIPGRLIKTPLRPGTGGQVFRRAIERDWLPALDAFRPEMIFVSAGFDAHRSDPLADLQLEAEDFAWVTERICEAADRHCDGRVVSTLEGGYALDALAASAAVHVEGLCDAGE